MAMHAIIYDRASTHLQEDNYSRVNAKNEGIRIAEQHGYTWEYVKEIGSGTTLSGRPKMVKILDRIADGEVQRIIVQDLDRLARPIERAVYEAIRTILIKYDVIVHTHSGRFDFSDDDNDFVADINMAVSKKEALRIRKRTRRGRVERAKTGKYMGGNPPFGYKYIYPIEGRKQKSDLAIDDDEAKRVRLIFGTLVATGGNIGKTAIILNEAGYTTRNGKRFMPNSIRKIAHRKIYIGIVESKLTDEIIHRPELQIISVSQFERVQALIDNRRKPTPGAKGQYPFTGFVVCGTCGGSMVGAKQGGGGQYYSCVTRRKFGPTACAHGRHYRHSSLVEVTAALIAATMQDSGTMERILNEAANEYGKTISEEALEAAIDGELKIIKESRQRLIDAIAGGILTQDDAAKKMNSLRDSEQRLTVERANISEKAAIRDEFIKAMEILKDSDIKAKLMTIAEEEPLTFRRLLGLILAPNSLKVSQSPSVLTIDDYQFTEAFNSLEEELSFCNVSLNGCQRHLK
jgi:site-specific DNA recombinase